MAGSLNLTLDQGADYSLVLTVKGATGSPTNLTGYTAYSQIRKSYYSTTAYEFTTGITAPTTGKIALSMSGASSSAMDPGRYLYDVEIYNGSNTLRVMEGIIEIRPQVTKIP